MNTYIDKSTPNAGCSILVVDDLYDNLFLLQTIFEAEGYTVETAESADVALNKLEVFQPHLILLDVMMPKMNGYELTQVIRQHEEWKEIPIVLITAHPQSEIENWSALGANGFLSKPFDFSELVERVNTFLSEETNCLDN